MKIIIIGTLHANGTPHNELAKVLEKYKPDQLLVEITQKDIEEEKLTKYPDEMIFAYNWAKKTDTKVNGFDSKINVMKEKKTEKDNRKAIEESQKLRGKLTWKDMNKENNLQITFPSWKDLVDWRKWDAREEEMLANIKNHFNLEGIVLILTGASHLKYFEKHLKDAEFPFR